MTALTLAAAAVASILMEGSHRMALMAEACCMHSWVVESRLLVVEARDGWDLRRQRVPERRPLPPG
jgi:hypothetical protein